MTLDDMNKYLEAKGFVVTRRRDSKRDLYIFGIQKNGMFVVDEFKYPKSDDWNYKNRQMEAFLDKMVRDFNKLTGPIDDVMEEKNMTMRANNTGTLLVDQGSFPVRILTIESRCGEFDHIECEVLNRFTEFSSGIKHKPHPISKQYVDPMAIKNVIHNDPATIVFWADGSKTVVKCQPGDVYDPEKGLAMAISKKALGNQGNYCNVFKKWVPEGNYSRLGAMPLDCLVAELHNLGISIRLEEKK